MAETNNTPHAKPLLSITSYALEAPPLPFLPDIRLNARHLSNPPLALRKRYDGRCTPLRHHLRSDPSFSALLQEARPQIFAAEKTAAEQVARGETDRVKVTVAVFCVRGRHRSVAVAEDLAKCEWLQGWEVRVWHRDVESPHRYLEIHRRNLERERRGEDVGVDQDEEAVEESEKSGGGEEGSESQIERSKGEKDGSEGLSRVDSLGVQALGGMIKELETPAGPTASTRGKALAF